MKVSIFNEVTTNEILIELEDEAKKYEGLYVDMDNKDERKYVKDKAVLISGLLKTLDRARIDKSKSYKILVEAEAANIKERLEDANKPFTLLIDEHKEKRAKELAKIKEVEDRKALADQIEADHEAAIMENKLLMFERAEAEKIEADRLEAQKAEAAHIAKVAAEMAARLAEERRIEAEKQAKIDADQAAENARLAEVERQKQEKLKAKKDQEAREANKKHLASVNNAIVDVLIVEGFSKEDAKKFVIIAAKKMLPKLTIEY